MDMQLNSETLRRQRELRAWSQSHLAEVAGLSMRTVQRIERTGSASHESAKALASALDTQVENLLLQTQAEQPGYVVSVGPLHYALAILILFSVLSVSTFVFVPGEPSYDLVVIRNDKQVAKAKLVAKQPTELLLNDNLKIQIKARQVADGVFFAADVYEYSNRNYQLKANPAVLAANNQTAKIKMELSVGDSFQFMFTPRTCRWLCFLG